MFDKRTLPIGVLVCYLFLFIVATIVQVSMMVSGLDPTVEAELLRMGSVSNLVGYGVAFVAIYILYFKYLKERFTDSIKNVQRTLIYIGAGFIALYSLSWILNVIYQVLGNDSIPQNQEALNALADAMMFDKIALIVYAVVLAPFVEEMVFRLGIMTVVRNIFQTNKTLGVVIALIVSSFLFGLVHVVGDIEQIWNYAVLGAVLGFVYYKTDNIYTSVYLHMVYNAVAAYVMFFM